MTCRDRHCPGARELSSARFVASLCEDSTQGYLIRVINEHCDIFCARDHFHSRGQ